MALINVPGISTGNTVDCITRYYERMIGAGTPCRDIRPIMMFGPTGVGKSSAVYQAADRLAESFGKPVKVVDVRLTSCTITDLIGIPVASEDRETTVWLRPEIYADDGDGSYYIYFFDELDKASPAVQAAALQLILDRKAWTHSFPENSFVIAAANPARGTSKYETRMAPELMNRFRHFNVQPDYDSFKAWAITENIHPYVLGFLSYDNSKLYAQSESDEIAFPTPRSWKSVSDLLYACEGMYEDLSELHNDIAGDIGTGISLEFEGWCSMFKYLPDTERIVRGEEPCLPEMSDVLHAVISSLTVYVARHTKEITVQELNNICNYAKNFPADFMMLFFNDLKAMENIKMRLMKVPAYMDWLKAVQKMG